MNNLSYWRFAGIVTITILGFLLHYLFSLTGGSKVIGLFVPVNESVWEHLKLGYWSVLLFSFVEYFQIKDRVNNYYFARIIGILSLEITIIAIFYVYTFIAGKDIFVIDIFSYIAGVVICQYLTYTFFRLKPFTRLVNRIALAAVIVIGILFGITSYYPPHIALFKDDNSETYGINKEK